MAGHITIRVIYIRLPERLIHGRLLELWTVSSRVNLMVTVRLYTDCITTAIQTTAVVCLAMLTVVRYMMLTLVKVYLRMMLVMSVR